MTNARAKEVLEGMEWMTFSPEVLEGNKLQIPGSVNSVSVNNGDGRGCMIGHFTADELEAIACWMRDPAGVCEGRES